VKAVGARTPLDVRLPGDRPLAPDDRATLARGRTPIIPPAAHRSVAGLPALSYSALRTYLECPQRYKFLYIDNLPETPRGYFSFGRTIHSALEALVRPLVRPQTRLLATGHAQRTLEEFDPRPSRGAKTALMPKPDLLALYRKLWISEGYVSEEEETRYRGLGEDLLSRYYDAFAADPPVPVAVEQHLEARWDGIAIHGYVDRIDLTPNGGLEVLDYKTSRGLSIMDARGSDQLSLYQVLVERNYARPVESLTIYDLRGRTAHRVPARATDALEPLRERVGDVADGIRAESFEPTPGRYCERCEFRALCPEFKEVPRDERPRLEDLVDRYARLREEGRKLDRELGRVADELHREAERLGLRRLTGSKGALVRRREDRWTVHPDAVRPILERHGLWARATVPDAEALRRLARDPAIAPEVRRALAHTASRSVRWTWEVEENGVGRTVVTTTDKSGAS
jgi:putative RecB family exonuclease